MKKTVFLSFLGTNEYLECFYQFPDNQLIQTKYTQIAVIQKHIEQIDEFIFILTEEAKNKNWNGDGKLKSELLNKLKLDGNKIKEVDIPNGFNNDDLLTIFSKLVDNVENESSLIIDVTHSFRSLPITLSSVLEYLKKVKKVTIENIYYGAFEVLGNPQNAKEKPLEQRKAPMLDITYLSAIQDWTTAIDHFLKFGNITKLKDLSNKSIKPILSQTKGQDQFASKIRNIVNTLDKLLIAIYTCRSKTIREIFSKSKKDKDNVSKLDELLVDLDYILNENYLLPQLNEPFKKVKEKINLINDNNVLISCVKIVQWCIDYNWIQQGYTLLQENLCSFIIEFYERDFNIKDEREGLSNALNIIKKNEPREKWKNGKEDIIKFYVDKRDSLMEIAELYTSLADFRNDINHAGYRENFRGQDTLVKSLNELYSKTLKNLEKLSNK